MTYTVNVPISGQTLGNSRPLINDNFSVINNDFFVNHVAFNSAGAGKHRFVQMPVTTTPATIVSEGAIYTQ